MNERWAFEEKTTSEEKEIIKAAWDKINKIEEERLLKVEKYCELTSDTESLCALLSVPQCSIKDISEIQENGVTYTIDSSVAKGRWLELDKLAHSFLDIQWEGGDREDQFTIDGLILAIWQRFPYFI